MNKKLYFILFLCVPGILTARRQAKRGGIIEQALQFPSSAGTPSLTLAAGDQISRMLSSDEPREGTFPSKHPQQILPQDSTVVGTEIADIAAPKDQFDYTLPTELQKIEEQKAKTALKKVEEKPEEDEKIELQFEDADLQNFVQQISDLFNITFISDENIDPLPQGTNTTPIKALKGNKISFKTNRQLSRQEAWDLFVTFLDIAGFAVVPQPDPTLYRIQAVKSAQRAPIPTYIGVKYENLPNNDQLIRYLYFIENASLESMQAVIPSLVSQSAGSPIFLKEHNAFILTDKSYNIRSLMQIVKELDQVTMPQAMSVLKLHQVDAGEVKKLYDELTQQEENKTFRPFGARKQPSAIYFPENARIIVEPRTNSLILLGPQDAIKKIEEFVIKYVDVELDQPYSPLHTYQLRYADAKAVAEIMNNTTRFGQNTEAGKSGGVRGTDKYLKQMTFTPEPSTNRLIIKGDYDDFLLVKKILDELDQPKPQVALEVLILTVTLGDRKEMGSQIRSKFNSVPALRDLLGNSTVFQTSGLRAGGTPGPIVTNPNGSGVQRLLGNLLDLVTQAPAGNTIITFGQDIFGVWGLFQVLRTITATEVVSNPFLIASNQTPARVSLGETRRVVSSITQVGNSTSTDNFSDDKAELVVDITPQINSDGMIVLNLDISNSEFTNRTNPSSGNKLTRRIKTQAILADQEVLALGGLVREEQGESLSKTPVLADIPVLGWLFKNQEKSVGKASILVLISTKIIPPYSSTEINNFTQEHLEGYNLMYNAELDQGIKDPIRKMFFANNTEKSDVNSLLFERHGKTLQRSKRTRRGRRKKQKAEPAPVEQVETKIVENKPAQAPPVEKAKPIVIAQAEQSHQKIKDKKRSSQQLQNFLSPADQGKSV